MQEAPRTTPLSQTGIVDAALSMTRVDGVPPSMRGLAAHLDVTPGALYRHVTNQEELVRLMIDVVMERVHMPEPLEDADPWTRIRIYILSLSEILDDHPGLDTLMAGHGDSSPAARARQKWLVRELQSAGLSRARAIQAYAALDTYWIGSRHRVERTRGTFHFGLDRLLHGLKDFAEHSSRNNKSRTANQLRNH